MPSFNSLIHNRTIQIALAIVGLIAVASLSYYLIQSAPPKVAYVSAHTGSITEDIAATGIVSPLQNPNLSFEVGGQVTAVHAQVGQKVGAGTLLASLDTGVLSANLRAAQAQLNLLQAGPSSVDLAGQRTSVSTAQQTLANVIANYPQTLSSTLSKTKNAVYTDADPLFIASTINNPALSFSTKTISTKILADQERSDLTFVFTNWQNELTAAGPNPSPDQLHTLTLSSLQHLYKVRTFLADLTTAINDDSVATPAAQSQQTAALIAVANATDTVNGLIASLTTADQSITSSTLNVQSAQDQLNVTASGAKSQTIEAQQAQVAAIQAQIRQMEIVAPFSGTIASVSVKAGDPVSANTPAISLIPNGTFEVDTYLPENQIPGLKVGNAVDVTLDAYGARRVFPATVSTIETSPSAVPGVDKAMGYKVTVAFTNSDSAISDGMHANVTIHAGSADGAILVPKTAVIINGAQNFVLQKTSAGLVKVPVTLGLSNADLVQILTGIAVGDQVSIVGAQ
jgi:RND family efflux transporter MFP subunit